MDGHIHTIYAHILCTHFMHGMYKSQDLKKLGKGKGRKVYIYYFYKITTKKKELSITSPARREKKEAEDSHAS